MKISLEWLKDYVDISLSPPELADALTHAGLEVEGVSEVKPAFRGVVAAKLLSFHPLAGSDHLSVCAVTDGPREYSIVCGAPNLRAGSYVALAREGAVLPGGLAIGRTHFQNVISEGMLCSEKELGLTGDAAGIMELDQNLQIGAALESALSLNDWVLDVNITPNRSDCLCVRGLAREVAALTGQTLRDPDRRRSRESGQPAAQLTSVIIDRPDLCPRYVAELIAGVKIAPAPFWMRRRLEASGVRAISNVVDVTNYVMLEMGQPLHAFDFDLLEEKRIVVRPARPGEDFTTLDGTQRKLPDEALMICDGKKPVALGGIMGGLNSEVAPGTTRILLESAYFDPMSIRKTSKRLGLSTEASVRFERGIDPNGCKQAAERAAGLIAALSGGAVAPGGVDNYPRKIEPRVIPLRVSRANQILGTSIGEEAMKGYLASLQLRVEADGPDRLKATPPTFRVDLHREIDLIEEIARLHGFQRIPVTLPSGRVDSRKKTKMQRAMERARILFPSLGFWEVINYSFISPKALQELRLGAGDRRIAGLRIQNPISEEQAIMRTTLIPGLLQVALNNFHRQNTDLKIFELGRVFFPREGTELPEEVEIVSGLLTGLREEEAWTRPKAEVDLFDLKGVLEAFLECFGMTAAFIPDPGDPFLHPGKAASLQIDGEKIGVMGEIHPEVRETLKLKQPVFLFELDFRRMAAQIDERRPFKPLARYPAVNRDLALIVDDSTAAGDILEAMRERSDGLITEVGLFDLYRGNSIPPRKKSLAFRLKYQREDRTLTDQEVNETQQKIMNMLAQRFGATLR